MVHAIVAEEGPDEFIKRIADPVWFQSLGTALAFMMSVIGLSLPEAVILRRVLKPPLLITFFTVIAIAIMLTGFLFNWIL
jgi:uncharacterized membrane protein YraQ (UPF0718 family)